MRKRHKEEICQCVVCKTRRGEYKSPGAPRHRSDCECPFCKGPTEEMKRARWTLEKRKEQAQRNVERFKDKTHEEIWGKEKAKEIGMKRSESYRRSCAERRKIAFPDKDWLYRKYWTEKSTSKQIADLCGCSTFYVLRVMGEYRTERRPRGGSYLKWTDEQKRNHYSKSPKGRAQAKEAMLERWRDPKKRKKMVESILKASHIKPNKAELRLDELLQRILPNKYRYVGDFSFFIAGKCPDFVSTNDQKKIIELFGDYYHEGDDGQERIALFKQYGYETLIIWEHELEEVKKLENTLFLFQKGVAKD